jgi:hypothetical protein
MTPFVAHWAIACAKVVAIFFASWLLTDYWQATGRTIGQCRAILPRNPTFRRNIHGLYLSRILLTIAFAFFAIEVAAA